MILPYYTCYSIGLVLATAPVLATDWVFSVNSPWNYLIFFSRILDSLLHMYTKFYNILICTALPEILTMLLQQLFWAFQFV